MTSSPYLLNETIRKHAQKYDFEVDSFYVDDLVGGENSIEGAFLLFKKLKLRFSEVLFHWNK